MGDMSDVDTPEMVDEDVDVIVTPQAPGIKPERGRDDLPKVDAAKNASDRVNGLVEDLPDVLQDKHNKVTEMLGVLEENMKLRPVVEEYCKAIEAADFGEINEFLSMVEGSEAIGRMAWERYVSQVDSLLLGAREVVEQGSAKVMTFGYRVSYNSVEDIELVIEEMVSDLSGIKQVAGSSESSVDLSQVHARILSGLDKYMFEGRVFEFDQGDLEGVLICHGDDADPMVGELFGNVADGEADNLVKKFELNRMQSRRSVMDKMNLANERDRDTFNMFSDMDEIPETVVIYAPTSDFLDSHRGYGVALQAMWIDWFRLPHDQKPDVVIFADGFQPQLYQKHEFQGFMFCSSQDELDNVLSLTKTLKNNQQQELYDPDRLAPGQREAYDNSDLREWENKTADTYQSLRHIFEVVSERHVLTEFARFGDRNVEPKLIEEIVEDQEDPKYARLLSAVRQYRRFGGVRDENEPLDWYEAFRFMAKSRGVDFWNSELKTCLDIGTGEGRIAGMLSRAGMNVMGMDISSEQLEKVGNRVVEEGAGIRGEVDNQSLSYRALLRLAKEGLLPGDLIEDDKAIENRLLTVEGDFFRLNGILNQELNEWHSRHPGVDPYEFFNESPYDNEYAFSDERDMFADVGFDMAMFNWHTFCETGSPENQKEVLEQILNVLERGGVLILEIPDRKVEPYASALRQYHEEYPDEPYGTIRDKKPEDFVGLEGEELYPPRYFPDINELILLLKSVGYEVSMDDVKTYLIQEEGDSGKDKMTLKEHFIVARKSAN